MYGERSVEEAIKALPVSVFEKLLENTFTPSDPAMGELARGVFYGRRSCEYLTVQDARKTKWLNVENIRFLKITVKLKIKHVPLLLSLLTQFRSHLNPRKQTA